MFNHSSEESINRVVIYTRVSSSEQVEGFSLDKQRKDLKDYAKKEGYKIVDFYEDAGISAKDVKSRPAFKEMLSTVKKKAHTTQNIDAILVWKLSRFSRSSYDLEKSLRQLEEYDCHLIATEDRLSTFDMMGKLIIKMLGIFAELERTNIVNNVMSGMNEGASKGHWMGGVAPYGYKTVEKIDENSSTLAINPDEAKTAKLIFEMYADNKGYSKIADVLNNKLHIKTRRGRAWTYTSLQQMLDNPTYNGKIRYGKLPSKSKNGRSGRIPDNELKIYDGLHEAIIDDTLWQAVRELRVKKGHKPAKIRETKHLLSGKVLCPECGTPMVSTTTSTKRKDGSKRHNHYYQCGMYNNTKTCKPNLVRKDTVDEQAIQILFNFLKDPKLPQIISEKIKQDVDTTPLEGAIASATKENKYLNKKISRGYDLLYENQSENMLSDVKIKEMIMASEEIITTNNHAILEHESKLLLVKAEKKTSDDIAKILNDFEAFYSKATHAKQKELLNYLIKSIEVHKDPDIKIRSQVSCFTLQFASAEIGKFGIDSSNSQNVWFTYDTVHHK